MTILRSALEQVRREPLGKTSEPHRWNDVALASLKRSDWLLACTEALDAGAAVCMLDGRRTISAAILHAAA